MGIARAGSGLPVGAVMHYPVNSIPAGWLKANGAVVSRTTYAALFATIGTTYGAGDGSTTFGLPDLRGEFLRGLDDGRGVDASRGIGTAQAGAIESHQHSTTFWGSGVTTGGSFPGFQAAASNTGNGNSGSATNASTLVGGTETRPRNVAMLACIKFRR